MNFAKIFGWLLLTGGVLIIGWSLYTSYEITTGKAEAPAFFETLTIETETQATKGKTPTTQAELQEEMQKMISEQLEGFLPPDAVPKMLNLVVWSMLVGLLIFGGGQISSLGIKLIKR